MVTPNFSGKLDALPATLDMLRDHDAHALAAALKAGSGRHALSIGSGGSAIAAEYLARCRDSLGLGPTSVQTPMQAVLEAHGLSGSDVWLFSAGGDNADVIAAAQAAVDRDAGSLNIVTRNSAGAAVAIVTRSGGSAHIVPVSDAKDGYLATHSLLASVTALLLASDIATGDPQARDALLDPLVSRLTSMRDRTVRAAAIEKLSGLARHHTVIVAADPLLRPMAVLLDTSIWEASLCHVQSTDFRNLAHGRHAWLHHRATETLILALTGADSRSSWSALEAALPEEPHRLAIEYGAGGRLDNVLGIIDGLGIVEAIGTVVRIDPGKPGIGDFGRSVYADRSLAETATAMTRCVRHKRSNVARLDTGGQDGVPLHEIWRHRLKTLAAAEIGGLVFDYDGTIVRTEDRFGLPTEKIVAELVRLQQAGLLIGIATGRGGSAGEDLRRVLPPDILPAIQIGYYNGGHLRTADIDIEKDPAELDGAIGETAAWLNVRQDLFIDHRFKQRGIQITVDKATLANPYRFALDMEDCPAFVHGRVRVAASGHSYDIVPARSSKLSVVETIKEKLPSNVEVLCFGDSGARTGNDNTLLAQPFGISVGEVCGVPNGCWSLFGSGPVGPEALLRILRALKKSDAGGIRLDVASLGLDTRP